MTQAEIKEIKTGLIVWITELSDINLLNMLESVRLSHTNKDWWDELSDVEKQHISEGIEDVENGRVISSEEFWKRHKQP